MKRKFFAVSIAAVMLLAMTGLRIAPGYELPDFGSVTGEVVEFWGVEPEDTDFVRIRTIWDTGDDEIVYSYADFFMDANTFFVGDEPQIGDTITGFFDNMSLMIMIYPPQYTAIAMVNRDEPRMILSRFGEDWISTDGNFRLNIPDGTEIVFQGGDAFTGETGELVGRKLFVEFDISHRDIPETIPSPQKITVLYERAVHPIGEIDWGDFPPEDLDTNFDAIPEIDENFPTFDELQEYVPLRAILENHGVVPQWDGATRTVTIAAPGGEIRLAIGSQEYTLTSQAGTILIFDLKPPIITNDRTYVPLQFFSDVFGLDGAALREIIGG